MKTRSSLLILTMAVVSVAGSLFIKGSATAQTTPNVSCGTISTPHTGQVTDRSTVESCGKCVWWTVKAGTGTDGVKAEFIRNESTANGSVRTCKTSTNPESTCTELAISGSVTCPANAAGYGDSDTGSGTGSGTGTGTGSGTGSGTGTGH